MLLFRVLIFFLLLCGSLQAQKKETTKKYLDEKFSLTRRANAYYNAMSVKVDDHWVLYAVYPDSSLLLKAWFKDRDLSVKDGPFEFNYGKGVKMIRGYFVGNQRHGGWKYWHPNGNLRDSGIFENNQMIGEWRSWHENGSLMAIGHYKYDSSVHQPKDKGTSRSLLPSAADLHSVKDGDWISFYDTGIKLDSGLLTNNRKNGLWKFWYPSGVLEAVGEYENDSLVNQWSWYRENGKPSTKEIYRGNKLVKMECFDEEGNYTGDYCSILKPPHPLGKFHDFQQYMMDSIQLPEDLRDRELKGEVTIQCEITKEGKLNKLKVTSPYKSLTEEVERFFNTLIGWSPAVTHNRPIKYTVEYKLPLTATWE